MKLYEISLLVESREELDKIMTEIQTKFEIKKKFDFGQKKLFYPIKKKLIGWLASVWFEAKEKDLSKITNIMKSGETILRYLILTKKAAEVDEPSLEERLKARKEAQLASAKKPEIKIKPELKQPEATKKKEAKSKLEIPSKSVEKPEKITKSRKKVRIEAKKTDLDEKKRLEDLDKKLADILKE